MTSVKSSGWGLRRSKEKDENEQKELPHEDDLEQHQNSLDNSCVIGTVSWIEKKKIGLHICTGLLLGITAIIVALLSDRYGWDLVQDGEYDEVNLHPNRVGDTLRGVVSSLFGITFYHLINGVSSALDADTWRAFAIATSKGVTVKWLDSRTAGHTTTACISLLKSGTESGSMILVLVLVAVVFLSKTDQIIFSQLSDRNQLVYGTWKLNISDPSIRIEGAGSTWLKDKIFVKSVASKASIGAPVARDGLDNRPAVPLQFYGVDAKGSLQVGAAWPLLNITCQELRGPSPQARSEDLFNGRDYGYLTYGGSHNLMGNCSSNVEEMNLTSCEDGVSFGQRVMLNGDAEVGYAGYSVRCSVGIKQMGGNLQIDSGGPVFERGPVDTNTTGISILVRIMQMYSTAEADGGDGYAVKIPLNKNTEWLKGKISGSKVVVLVKRMVELMVSHTADAYAAKKESTFTGAIKTSSAKFVYWKLAVAFSILFGCDLFACIARIILLKRGGLEKGVRLLDAVRSMPQPLTSGGCAATASKCTSYPDERLFLQKGGEDIDITHVSMVNKWTGAPVKLGDKLAGKISNLQ